MDPMTLTAWLSIYVVAFWIGYRVECLYQHMIEWEKERKKDAPPNREE